MEVTSLVSEFAKERVRLEMGLHHASAAVFAEIFVAFRLGMFPAPGLLVMWISQHQGKNDHR